VLEQRTRRTQTEIPLQADRNGPAAAQPELDRTAELKLARSEWAKLNSAGLDLPKLKLAKLSSASLQLARLK
jgi:hypothetical protein